MTSLLNQLCYLGQDPNSFAPKVMRLRPVAPQIRPRPSALRGLLLYNYSVSLTPSESTLPQVLISRDFKSFKCNTYKKPGEGPLLPPSGFCNSLPPATALSACDQTPATPFISCNSGQLPSSIGVGVRARLRPQIPLSISSLKSVPCTRAVSVVNPRCRATGHGTDWHESPNSAQPPEILPCTRSSCPKMAPLHSPSLQPARSCAI